MTHEWKSGQVFVFGSNLQGIHGAGAAKFALEHCGAVWGVGKGIQMEQLVLPWRPAIESSYAIPTKTKRFAVLPLVAIKPHVDDFLAYVRSHPGLTFFLTRIGCGLAGYKDEQMAELFKTYEGIPSNVIVPPEWKSFL